MSLYNIFKTSVSNILKPYISNKIPESQTNVFWMLFSGIDHSFTHLENLIKSNKRERNMLTAQHIASLRTLASSNGFEPVLKIPSRGIVDMTINQKLFNRAGFPIYLPPFATFTNNLTGVTYYYDSNKTLKIDSTSTIIPLVEGEISMFTHQSTGDKLERIYIDSNAIAHDSISVSVGNINFLKVDSFINHPTEDYAFVVKFSEKPSSPIVIYVKGTTQDETVKIVHRSTFGESGNINYETEFTTNALLDRIGNPISISDDDLTISNISGFNLGSNGTDKNTLKASIGFNHGVDLLFDTVSYTSFISRYSTLMLQNIALENPLHKSINTIYVGRKNELTNKDDILIDQYKQIITEGKYLLSKDEINNLTNIIEENEFALSSHILKNLKITKYAIQIVFNSRKDVELYSDNLNNKIYYAFGMFLNSKANVLNLELLFNNFMNDNNIVFEYDLFNSDIEQLKIVNKNNQTIGSTENNVTIPTNEIVTSYIIKHENSLPILKGDFPILSNDNNSVDLFFDINTVIKL